MHNQYICILPGETVSLVNNSLVSSDPQPSDLSSLITGAIDAFRELYNFVRPLAIDLILECQDQTWSTDPAIEPKFPCWHLQTLHPPNDVMVKPYIKNPLISQALQLTPEIILEWLETALNQPGLCPDSYCITWRSITFSAVEARIPNEGEFVGHQSILVKARSEEFNLRLDHREDGVWIAAPIRQQLSDETPFTLSLSQAYGGLQLKLLVNWSLWTEPCSSGLAVIQGAISRLLNRGWEISYLSSVFTI